MHNTAGKYLGIILICSLLSGCIALAGGTMLTGAAVAHDRRTTGTIVEDRTIQMKAYQAIRSDDEVRENTHINVTAYNTVMLLTGEAPTASLRDRILELVKDVEQVSRIYNEIEITEPSSFTSRSSDSLITTRVKTRLFATGDIDATKIKVVTERGIVYLMGLLTEAEADIATEAARTVSGVQKVVRLFQRYEKPPKTGEEAQT